MAILGMVADHPWPFTWALFYEFSLVAKFQVCCTFLSSRFWWGLFVVVLVSCDGGKTKSSHSPIDLDWTGV